MLIRRAEEIPGSVVTMPGASSVEMRMMVGRSDGAPNFAMRHFTVSPGGHTPRHSHNYEHEVFIVSGEGTTEADGNLYRIREGDVVFVPANVTHQFVNTGREALRFLCLVPLNFDCAGECMPVPGSG